MNDRQRARREERQRRREEYQRENEKDNQSYTTIFGRTYTRAKWFVIRLGIIHYLKKFWALIKERVDRGG